MYTFWYTPPSLYQVPGQQLLTWSTFLVMLIAEMIKKGLLFSLELGILHDCSLPPRVIGNFRKLPGLPQKNPSLSVNFSRLQMKVGWECFEIWLLFQCLKSFPCKKELGHINTIRNCKNIRIEFLVQTYDHLFQLSNLNHSQPGTPRHSKRLLFLYQNISEEMTEGMTANCAFRHSLLWTTLTWTVLSWL